MTAEVEALVLLATEGVDGAGAVDSAVTAAGGRLVAGFLPHALIVLVAEEALDDLRRSLGKRMVYADVVPVTVVEAAQEPLRSVLTAWNERRGQADARPVPRGVGQAWDAPGFLPPDPPLDVREALRRREQQEDEAADDLWP